MNEDSNLSIQQYVELNKRINEVYYQDLLEYHNRLELVQNTKAWKVMCLLRRVNEQFIKGDKIEKKKFFKWINYKLLKKPISKEQELLNYSPIPYLPIKEFKLPNYEVSSECNSEIGYQKPLNIPKKIDIFRFPVIEWDFRWQRPQQISVQFEKNGHRVFYFSIDTYGINNKDATFYDISQNTIVKELQDNIYWVKLCTLEPLNAYRDNIDGLNLKFVLMSIESLKNKFNIGATLSILDLPFWSDLALALKNNTVIYDCMDDHEGFSTNSSEMLSRESELIQSSDIVLASSQRLYDKMLRKNQNTLLVRNAGEFEHFSKNPNEVPEQLENLKGPIIGYYGAISEWFDIKLIEDLAIRNKNWTFVLVGNTFGCDISKAEKLGNVVFTGEVPYAELPKYLYKFDVCLIPFLVNNLTLATNPVKVYEYLAAGKPVVSTRLPELEYMSDLVLLADNTESFEECIKSVLNEKDNTIVEKRKEFASNNTWKTRYHEIAEYLIHDYPKVSIVIVTYNNWSYTKQCLDSLFINNEYRNVEIIVVDNLSTDETRVQLAKINHPNLKIYLSSENLGFAGGNNIGCKMATGDYLILLNNDTIVTSNWIENLIKPLRENDELGMVGPVSNSVGNDQMLDFFIGDSINGPSKAWLEDFWKFNSGKYRYSDLLGFYCVAMKKEVYEKVRELDMNYGIGMFEDDDYCERVKNFGYKLAIVEDVFIYHHGSVSFKKLKSDHYKKIWEKNKKYFESKWNKKWEMPKPPNSLFLNIIDPNEIAKIVKQTNLTPLLVIGNWSEDEIELKDAVLKLSENENNLVFVFSERYNNEEYHGLRKAANNVYFTNQLDILSKVEFEKGLTTNSKIELENLKVTTIVNISSEI